MLTYKDITDKQQDLIDAMYGGNVLAIAPKGMGKTVCAQTAAQELIKDGVCERVLIMAPLQVCNLNWASEHENWEHLYAPGMATGTPAQRAAVIEGDDNIVVINNDNVAWFCDSYDPWEMGFDGLLIDESTKYKSSGATKVRKMRKYLKDFKWRCGLSASPLSEAGIDIYAQVLMVDNGKALGRLQDLFRRKYFMTEDFSGYSWIYQPGGEERLAHDLRNVLFVADGEAYEETLPELREHLHFIQLPERAQNAYASMARDLLVEFEEGEDVEAANMAVRSQKLQQIAAGAMYREDGTSYLPFHDEKVAWVKSFLRPHHRVLIGYWYAFELEMLRAQIPDLSVLKDDPAGLKKAWNSHEISRLAVHPSSASHGLNLQSGGHTLICLGPVWSSDAWSQLVGRLRRRGQKSPYVDRHTIMAADTVDEIIWDRLQGKEFDENVIMNHIIKAGQKNTR